MGGRVDEERIQETGCRSQKTEDTPLNPLSRGDF